jgi:DNA-binding GntR family transcriptional regulator
MTGSYSKESRSRVEVAYLSLRQAIIEQALEPGTKLPEDVIGSGFDMSRTLAREVLTKLQSSGLVDVKRKRTATVARPSLMEAQEVFLVRRCLEREVIRLLCQRWSKKTEQTLQAHIRAEEKAAAAGNSAISIRLAGEFHIRMAELSGNHLLRKYVDEVVSRGSLILAVYGRPHSPECAVAEHSALVSALAAGDVERTTGLMEEHLGSVEQRAMISGSTPVKRDLHDIIQNYAGLVNGH